MNLRRLFVVSLFFLVLGTPQTGRSMGSKPSIDSTVLLQNAIENPTPVSPTHAGHGLALEQPLPDAANFTTKLELVKIKTARSHRRSMQYPRIVRCGEFLGTHAGNKIYFQATAQGGSGVYKHTLVYTLSGFSKSNDPAGKRIQHSRNLNGKFKIKLPELKDEISHIQFTALLISEDQLNPNLSAENHLTFNVSRPVIFSKSTSEEGTRKECFERYQAHETSMGLISNTTNQIASLDLNREVQKSSATTQGWIAGVYFSPVAFVGVGNPLLGNLGYFRQTTRQLLEKINANLRFQILPGQHMKLFTQPTRYIKAFDATFVDSCGKQQTAMGAYLFQSWSFSYFLHEVNPTHPNTTIPGTPPINTCPRELNPFPSGESPEEFQFVIF